ncbi:MAG: hypothetical protein LBE36_12260 [Flavobacteriaceae bacterium]|jgi:hypothetical protein|nr:hypothetical protein [Flavobacteriaceae bacterium]
MNIFLKLKHWQLFVLQTVIPIVLEIIVIVIMAVSNNFSLMRVFFPFIMILFMGTFFGWFYAMGKNLNKKLPDTVKMSLAKFQWFLIIPIVYMIFLVVFMPAINKSPNPIAFIYIIPAHLFSMFCIFYCLYFVAKSFKAVELQRPVTFSDYAGEFFLLWFYPVGVWIIQPKVNKMFGD